MLTLRAALALALVSTATLGAGCGSYPAMLRTLPPQMPDVALHDLPTVFVADQTSATTVTSVAFRSRLRELLESAGARVVAEQDAGGAAVRPGDLVVRVASGQEITQTESGNDDPCLAWSIPLTVLTGGTTLTAVLLCTGVVAQVHTYTPVEVRIFDAEGATITTSDDGTAHIDMTGRSPVLRGEYAFDIEVQHRDRDGEPIALSRAIGAREAEQLVAQLLPDLRRAESLVRRDAPMAVDLGTSGGEVPAS